MRLFRSLAPAATVAVALVLCLPYEALPHARVEPAGPAARPEPFGAECRTTVRGSHVVAYCHNAYAETDRVRLHIECDRWWDLDSDGAPTDAGPAVTVRLTGRCWKEVRSAWVSHQRG
ncbi:hypothetical protein [Streptomyces sp. CAI-85]|uniref:hypothetical protein n=1 Tax=Streptomyces sp. CAI-85 TaxID=1472662 RepID=UPI001587AF9F|nr:hypothetical protein [Streptomyces sp. CAI-85]NUV65079.1 hypothetical protein [Streptomyces sp. CAI-85]